MNLSNIGDIGEALFSESQQEKFLAKATALSTELYKKRSQDITDEAVLADLRITCLRETMLDLIAPHTAKLTQQPILSWNSLGHKAAQAVITGVVLFGGVVVATVVTGGRKDEGKPSETETPTETATNPFEADFTASARPRKQA